MEDMPEELDFSVATPFRFPLSAPLWSDLSSSRLIFHQIHMSDDPYDVFEITVSDGETQTLSSLAPLVPACRSYLEFYPR